MWPRQGSIQVIIADDTTRSTEYERFLAENRPWGRELSSVPAHLTHNTIHQPPAKLKTGGWISASGHCHRSQGWSCLGAVQAELTPLTYLC